MNKPKKIIFKLSEFPHLSETFIVAQIVTAINLGYEVAILVHKVLEAEPNLRSSLIAQYGLMDKIKLEDYNIPINKFSRLYKWIVLLMNNSTDIGFIYKFHKEQSQFSLTWLYQWQFYKQLNEAVLFHVQYGTSARPLDVLKKTGFLKPKLIVTFHGHDAFFPINGYISQEGYYDNLFRYADLITANTPYLGDKLIEIGCPEVMLQLIPVGVDTDFFYPNKREKSFTETLKLISVGRLDKVKGHLYCIEVVHQLINMGIDIRLTIIGEGEERNSLENLIVEYQLQRKVFLLGKKSQNEVRDALWNHDVYMLTAVALLDGRRETQGLATLEAQACGLPAIVFDSGGVKYTVDEGNTGFVCQEYNVQAICNKILKLKVDPILLSKMNKQAVTFVNNNFSQKFIELRWGIIYSNFNNGK